VKLTLQLEAVVLPVTVVRVQGLGVPKLPAAAVLNITVPAGGLAVPAAASVTVAVQDEAWFTTTMLGAQETVVVVTLPRKKLTVIV
jgi:hypothetical protein